VLLGPTEFSDLRGRLGIGGEHVVVAYDQHWGLAAARLVWALHRYGHTSAAVLDGGWDRWIEEGRGVSDQREEPAHAVFEATPDPSVSADLPWLSQRLLGIEPKLLDTRTQVEYDAGHLPNAILWDWFNAVPTGSWDSARDPAELRAEWEGLGLDPSQEVVVYCRSGMRAAHTYVVLKHAGYTRVRLYDGSWQEWSMKQ
jgi:thiosulfate/3-mercaptopyruvate sulfurtransferase